MNVPIKLIVSDMDDTLLTSKATITPRTARALARARELGAHVVLASGRMTNAMKKYVTDLQLSDPIIAYNGALIQDPRTWEILNRVEISCMLSRELAKMAEEIGVHVQGYWDDAYFYEKDNAFSTLYAGAVGVQGSAMGVPLSVCIQKDNTKMLLIDEPARITALAPVFMQVFGDRLDCAISRPNYLECTNRLATKGNALEKVLDMLNVRPEEVVAFGDGQNDLTMLKMAGLGYAPANARAEVRAQAGRVCPANDEEGVACILEEMMDQDMIGGR